MSREGTRHHSASQQLTRENLQLSRELGSQTTPLRQTNRTYEAEENKFKAWVDRNRANYAFGLTAGHYVSKNSVETYYLQEQSKRLVQPKTLARTCKAIDHLSDREASPLSPNTDIREGITGRVVKQVIVAAKKKYDDKVEEEEKDPHENNPFNVISQENISKVMMTKLRQGKDWEDAIICWAVTTTTLLRFDSAAAVTLDKLFLIEDLPPWGIETPFDGEEWKFASEKKEEFGDGRMLGILCPPLDQRKKNKTRGSLKTEGVGAYRHKRFERCPSGMIAFGLLQKIELNRGRISFKKRGSIGIGQLFWRDFKLFDLSYGTAYDQYNKMLEDAGVEKWLKTTHMRKVGSTLCTAQGLQPQEVSTLSKHSTRQDNFDKSYGCEVSIPVASTIAGFRPRIDCYFVPRTTVAVPCNCTRLLFPELERWILEIRSVDGDNSKGATHFIEKIIPYLTEVILQDGVYWVKEFRRNPVVELLLRRLDGRWEGSGNYTTWSRIVRETCKGKIKRYHSEKTLSNDKLMEVLKVTNEHTKIIAKNHHETLHAISSTRKKDFCEEEFDQLNNVIIENQPHDHDSTSGYRASNGNQLDLEMMRPNNLPRRATVLSLKQYGSIRNLISQYYVHLHNEIKDTPSIEIVGCAKPKMMMSRIQRLNKRVEDKAKELYSNDCNINVEAIIAEGKRTKSVPDITLRAACHLDIHEREKRGLASYERWLAKGSAMEGKYAPSISRKRKGEEI